MGSAAALTPEDVVFAQYREQGVLLYRGFSFLDFAHQARLPYGRGTCWSVTCPKPNKSWTLRTRRPAVGLLTCKVVGSLQLSA